SAPSASARSAGRADAAPPTRSEWRWTRSSRTNVPVGSDAPVASAVFLDRDGVLIESLVVDGVPRPPGSLDDVVVLPGVGEACSARHARGWRLIVGTNQPAVARGTVRREDVDAANALLRALPPLDDVVVCDHDDDDHCACRKPAPGMLLEAAGRHGVALADSV